MPDALRLALTTLTVAPVRGPRTLDRRTAGRAMELASFVGLLLGGAVAVAVHLLRFLDSGDLLAAAIGITLLAALTRGLHLDGLADVVDGLASYRDPEATRAVMKSPEVGPLGVAALVLTLLVQVAALQRCLHHHAGTLALLCAVVTARLAMTAACRTTAAATEQGLGAMVACTVRRGVTTTWAVAVAVGFGLWARFDGDADGTMLARTLGVWSAVAITLAGARVLREHVTRRTGGLTGDVLGAVGEAAFTVCLVVLALAL